MSDAVVHNGGIAIASADGGTNVVRLRPTAVSATFAPVPELIDELEKLIAQAKTGKLRAAAWAVVFEADAKPDGEVSCGWARGPYTSFGVSAALERLNYRWKKHEHET